MKGGNKRIILIPTTTYSIVIFSSYYADRHIRAHAHTHTHRDCYGLYDLYVEGDMWVARLDTIPSDTRVLLFSFPLNCLTLAIYYTTCHLISLFLPVLTDFYNSWKYHVFFQNFVENEKRHYRWGYLAELKCSISFVIWSLFPHSFQPSPPHSQIHICLIDHISQTYICWTLIKLWIMPFMT